MLLSLIFCLLLVLCLVGLFFYCERFGCCHVLFVVIVSVIC